MFELTQPQPLIRAFLTFRVLGRLHGIDIAQVREVSMHMVFTPVPQAPLLVRGLANLRSRIYLVLDSSVAIAGEPAVCSAESRLIVLHDRLAENLGLLVERGGDIVQVPIEQIEDATRAAAEPTLQAASSPVVALCKLEGELMMVIDPGRIVAALETTIRSPAAGSESVAATD